MKKIIHISLLIGGFAILFGLLGFANNEYDKQLCNKMEVNVFQTYENHFVDNEDINTLVLNKNGRIKGQNLKGIDTKKIENQVLNNPYVKSTDVYRTVNGKVIIDVEQRKPLARIITTDDESFYLDEDKLIMPLSTDYTARILLVNGNISSASIANSITKSGKIIKNSKLDEIFKLSDFINKTAFYKAQIEQIYVNQEGEYELIPKVGRHVILLGNIIDYEIKFNKLNMFYNKGLPQVGWDRYKLVNLKYKNQIVCTKKE